jgi:hypothetical protein
MNQNFDNYGMQETGGQQPPPVPAHTRMIGKLTGAMMRGYKGLHLPVDLKDKMERDYEEAFEKQYNAEQALIRRAQQ